MSPSPILSISSLASPWRGADPFLFMAHHLDLYPQGDGALAPVASLAGRQMGSDFANKDGWNMYHGERVPGFPAHPHRGFETITVVTQGYVDHADSLGGKARYGMGDVQWLTAGGGIMHSEMFPLLDANGPNTLNLAQIWLNLPAASKMSAPNFSMFWNEDIPVVDEPGEVQVKVIAGAYGDATPLAPPPDSWAARPEADVAVWLVGIPAGASWSLPAGAAGLSRSLHLLVGDAVEIEGTSLPARHTAQLRSEATLSITNRGEGDVQVLLLQGRPIGEPVATYGPFVMNTPQQIQQAFADFQRTRFGDWPFPDGAPTHGDAAERFAVYPGGEESRPGDAARAGA
ncbi:pirin family protein [Denitratimonas sp. CY0512]|uniref:pirin family protein n=1 Tax=Denitratimonas sp. CY0512 TaxID=3131940 RepID=UPI0030988002